MLIPASAVTASPLRDPALPVPQPPPTIATAMGSVVADPVKKTPETTLAQAKAALAEINKTLRMASIGVQFDFDKEADKTIVKVVDQESGEVIRQMPTEEALRISKALGKMQGFLMHKAI